MGVPDEVKRVIEQAQPCRWEDPKHPDAYRVFPLWKLNELDVIDKHRRLTVTAASLTYQAISVPAKFEPDTRFSFATGPVYDGQVLVSYLGSAEGVRHMADRTVAIMEPTVPAPTPVKELLASLQREVTNIVWRMDLAQRQSG